MIVPLEVLEREITPRASNLNADTCRFLLLIAEFDRRQGMGGVGCEVVRALAQLSLRHRAARGARAANPESEAFLIDMARQATAPQVEVFVRSYRRATEAEQVVQANERDAKRSVRWYGTPPPTPMCRSVSSSELVYVVISCAFLARP